MSERVVLISIIYFTFSLSYICSIISTSNISRPGSPHKLTSIITSLLSQRNKQQILPPGSPVNSNPTILWNRQNFSNEETAANVKDVAPNEYEETKDHGIYLSFKVFIVLRCSFKLFEIWPLLKAPQFWASRRSDQRTVFFLILCVTVHTYPF